MIVLFSFFLLSLFCVHCSLLIYFIFAFLNFYLFIVIFFICHTLLKKLTLNSIEYTLFDPEEDRCWSSFMKRLIKALKRWYLNKAACIGWKLHCAVKYVWLFLFYILHPFLLRGGNVQNHRYDPLRCMPHTFRGQCSSCLSQTLAVLSLSQ